MSVSAAGHGTANGRWLWRADGAQVMYRQSICGMPIAAEEMSIIIQSSPQAAKLRLLLGLAEAFANDAKLARQLRRHVLKA